MADGVIGTRDQNCIKRNHTEVKNKLFRFFSNPHLRICLNLLKIIKSTDVSEYWCSSNLHDAALKLRR